MQNIVVKGRKTQATEYSMIFIKGSDLYDSFFVEMPKVSEKIDQMIGITAEYYVTMSQIIY